MSKVKVKGVGVVYIHSAFGSDLTKWYSSTMDLPIKAEFPGWTEFEMEDGTRFGIDHIAFPSSVVQRQAVLISFEVEDIKAAVEEMAGRGARFYPSKEKTIFDVGPTLVATFEDPEGNWMQLNQRK